MALPHRLSGLGLILVFAVGDGAPVSSAKLIFEPDPTRPLVCTSFLPTVLCQPQLMWKGMRVGNTLCPLFSFPRWRGFSLCPRLKG